MIRAAVPEDAASLGALVVRAWRWALTETVPPETLAELDPVREADVLGAAIADPRTDVLVDEVGGRPVAVALLGACREPDIAPGAGALGLLAVDPPAQGAGVGTALHAEALTALGRRGPTEVVARMPRDHEHGRAFLEGLGWTLDVEAAEVEAAALGGLPCVRYRRPAG